jgi:hypothetical protein
MERKMTLEEKERLEASIAKSQELLSKDLFQPEAASQIRRMIAYDQDRIRRNFPDIDN